MQFKELKRKPYSDHPGDRHLSIVLSRVVDNEITPFATHIENSSVESGQKPFLVEGRYHKYAANALLDFAARGRPVRIKTIAD